jgi:hypothetical protein
MMYFFLCCARINVVHTEVVQVVQEDGKVDVIASRFVEVKPKPKLERPPSLNLWLNDLSFKNWLRT